MSDLVVANLLATTGHTGHKPRRSRMATLTPSACYKVGCLAPAERGTTACEQHRRPRRPARSLSSHSKQRHGRPWQRLRRMKLRRNPLCQDCLAQGVVRAAVVVDHVVALSLGGSVMKLENLRSLCHNCHVLKTTEGQKKIKAQRLAVGRAR